MMETFHKIVNITIGIADPSGKLLVSVGRQEVCDHFHCANPESLKLCVASHTVDCSARPSGQYRLFKCRNNMWNVATPIVIGGHEIGKLMAGEFLLEEAPFDEALFRDQARRYGYDEGRYLQKLAEVPRIRRELVDNTMNFFMELANMISQLGYNRITLARSLGERIRLMDSLREREEIFSTIFNQAADGMALIDVETLWFAEFNEATCQTFGYTREEFASLTLTDLITDMTRDEVARHIREVADAGRGDYIAKRRHHSGRLIDMNISTRTIRLHGRDFIAAIWRDVTEQRRAEEALRLSEQRFRDVSEAAGEFIWELDSTGRLTYLSDRVESVLGFKPEELVGTPAFGHMPAFEIERYKTLLHDPETARADFTISSIVSRPRRANRMVSATAVPMAIRAGVDRIPRATWTSPSARGTNAKLTGQPPVRNVSELNKTVTHSFRAKNCSGKSAGSVSSLPGFKSSGSAWLTRKRWKSSPSLKPVNSRIMSIASRYSPTTDRWDADPSGSASARAGRPSSTSLPPIRVRRCGMKPPMNSA